jgi:hypothetical protein
VSFHLDSDSIEVEGMPCDAINERAMKLGSFALLGALNEARGLPPPMPPARPRRAALAPLDRGIVERFLRASEEPKPIAPRPIIGERLGHSVIRSVAEAYEIDPEDVTGKCRSRHLICARVIASRLLRDLTWKDGTARFSLPQIGRMLNRDHSTICYHLDVFDAYCRKYPFMREVYDALREGQK